jgi:ubiquinone/menaquinone biosynthesis C-methylase UbiE
MPYTAFDRFVAWCRFRAARFYVRRHARVCDLGCGLGSDFLRWLGPHISLGVGVDLQVSARQARGQRAIIGDILGLPMRSASFDHVVMLAVLEHLVEPDRVLREAYRILAPGGSLIMTWPNAAVDPVLHVLRRVGIVSAEMDSDKHEPRIPVEEIRAMLRKIGFERESHRTFELGLNNVLVAYKTSRT